MSAKTLLDILNLSSKLQGNQLLIDCPACGKPAHCYVDTTSGLWFCQVCKASGNAYQLVNYHKPDATPAQIMKLLDEHDLAIASKAVAKPRKDLSWLRDKLRKPDASELRRACATRNLDPTALQAFKPYVHKTDPVMYLPGCVPGQGKAVGFLRIHLDGKLIDTRQGPQKNPIIGNWGLLGIWACKDSESIVFAEGWADALSAIEAGYVACASTGGTGWQAEWLPLFKNKIVIIVGDCDQPGVDSAGKRAQAISAVAKSVKVVELPYKLTETNGKDLRDWLQGVAV